MNKFDKTILALSVGLALGVGITPMANAYDSITILGTYSVAQGINDSGQVVGYSYPADYTSVHPVLWNGTTPTVLDGLGGVAQAINNSGQVVGGSATAGSAVIWNGTTPTILDGVGGVAQAINNSGQVVGSSSGQAVLWNGTTPTVLGALGGTYSHAFDINDSGQVVGDIGWTQAVLWNGTTPTVLGGFETFSNAFGINNSGQVVGYGYNGGNVPPQAVLWNGTTPTLLGGLSGSYSQALGINDSGQVVGWYYSADGMEHGTIWSLQNGIMVATDLNTLIDPALGYTIGSAQAINNHGQVVGWGTNSLGVHSAYVMSVAAVPEPGEWLLMLCGLGLTGFIATRRKIGSSADRMLVH